MPGDPDICDKLTIEEIDTKGTSLIISSYIGTNNVTFAEDFNSSGGDIYVNAENITVNDNVVVSSRQATGDQETAPSTGDSGHITFDGELGLNLL